jgi:hypothetical protein
MSQKIPGVARKSVPGEMGGKLQWLAESFTVFFASNRAANTQIGKNRFLIWRSGRELWGDALKSNLSCFVKRRMEKIQICVYLSLIY